MFTTPVTFNRLPEVVVYPIERVSALQDELRELRNALAPPSTDSSPSITVKEACKLLEECKNTLHEKARTGIMPAYKNPGGKAWRFIKSELLEYMASGKPKSRQGKYDEMVAEMNKDLHSGRRNRISR